MSDPKYPTDVVLAAATCAWLKSECEAQHARAERAEADLARLRLDLEARTQERDRLKDWKESAIESLGRWHQCGETLLKFVPESHLGESMSDVLWKRIPEIIREARNERLAAKTRVTQLTQERDEARQQSTAYHRRAQQAEAALVEKIGDSRSIGRALANAGYHRWKERAVALSAALETYGAHLFECPFSVDRCIPPKRDAVCTCGLDEALK
jgi:DNA repair exonuclease SbcCD ATPase subunit